MRKSLYGTLSAVLTLASALRANGTVNGTTVDRNLSSRGFRAALLVVQTAALTDGVHTLTIQDSDDGTAWANAAAEHLQGAAIVTAAANDDVIFEQGYNGPKRYVRAVVVTSGATTGGVLGAQFILGDPRRGVWR